MINAENMTANGGEPTAPEGVKTFTQEEVNQIVSRRLAEDRTKHGAELAKREQELAQREAAFQKQELESKVTARLTARGLSADFLTLVDTSSPEAMERTLSIIEKNTPQTAAPRQATAQRVGGVSVAVDPIRQAMGLERK